MNLAHLLAALGFWCAWETFDFWKGLDDKQAFPLLQFAEQSGKYICVKSCLASLEQTKGSATPPFIFLK